jgi:hypothetical protein
MSQKPANLQLAPCFHTILLLFHTPAPLCSAETPDKKPRARRRLKTAETNTSHASNMAHWPL